MNDIIGSFMCRGSCVVMGTCVGVGGGRTVHGVGGTGAVCFGGRVVPCGEEGVSIPFVLLLEMIMVVGCDVREADERKM